MSIHSGGIADAPRQAPHTAHAIAPIGGRATPLARVAPLAVREPVDGRLDKRFVGACGAPSFGAIQADRARSGSAHVDWCYDRYRSYRSSDNTFQPYQGPRRACNSPYG